MTIRDQAKKLATGASVALATSGLSSCNNNGAVDPPPPPLQCNTLSAGQSLTATATLSGDTVNATIRHNMASWRVDRVTAISGATLVSSTLPRPITFEPLTLVLKLSSTTTTQATFSVEATAFGADINDTCSIARTFTVTILPTGSVQITNVGADELPLAARQQATIVFERQEGRTVDLSAHTPYIGPHNLAWSVNAGDLDVSDGPAVRWTLPAQAGIYQAELVIDFGEDGFAFDVLLLEVA